MKLYREYWHNHDAAYMKKRGPINFAQRFYDAFGFAHEAIRPQWNIDEDYSHSWVLLEDSPGYGEKFASVFDSFNIFTTLNRYTEEYAVARDRHYKAKRHLQRLKRIKPEPTDAVIKERERELAALDTLIPKECFVDLGFDFDAGSGKEIGTLEESAILALKLLRHFEKNAVPCQVFYTGGRGFHIVVNHSCFEQPLLENNHLVNKFMAEMIEDKTGGLLIDLAIYSSRRQFRLPNSIHKKSGLYKVFITRDDLERGIEHIRLLAAAPRPIPAPDHTPSEYLSRLYGLARAEVDKKPKYEVKKTDIKELQAARQSAGDSLEPAVKINLLHHPPCVRDALTAGIKDGSPANRNLVTVFLATYFKAIGRGREETSELLADHARRILSRFSGSDLKTIEASTRGAVSSVFRADKYRFSCAAARKYLFTCNDTCELFKKYRESVFNRRLLPTEKKEYTGPNIYETQDGIRTAIVDQIDGYLRQCERSDETRGKALLVRAPAGAGKTTLTFDYFAARRRDRVCWVASQHALYDNIPDALKSRWLRIEGRHEDVYDDKGNIISDATCFHADDAKRLRQKRLNVNRLLCANCDDRHVCPYLAQFHDLHSNWFIQQRTFLYKAVDFISNFDAVVFDEDILANFREEITVTAQDASVLLKYVDILIDDMEDYGSDGIEGYVTLRRILFALETMLSRDPPRKAITGDILHRRLDEICVELHGTPLRDLMRGLGRDQYEIIDRIYFDIRKDELPLDFAGVFLSVLRFELFEKKTESNLSRLELRGHKKKKIESTDGRTHDPALLMYYKIPMPPVNKPVVVLDATGHTNIYTELFERDIILFDAAYRFRNKVIQIYSSASTITSLGNKRHLERMLDALKYFLTLQPNTLVIAKKSLEPIIRPLLPPGAAFTWYYGNRGSNEFIGFKQVIAFGSPGFDMETVLMYASCLYYDRNLSTDTCIEPRTYTGTDKAINVFRFQEQLVQNILEVSREDEVYQSLNRPRLFLDPTIQVILMTNIVLKQLEVTELISLEDVSERHESTKVKERRDIIRLLIERHLDSIGFVSVARTIRPFLEIGHGPPRAIARYFSDRNAVIPMPDAARVSKRSLHRIAAEIASEQSLISFKLFYKDSRSNGFIEILGRDADCLDAATRFFQSFPGCEDTAFYLTAPK